MRELFRQWALIAKKAQEQGQGLVEYAVLLVFIAIVAVASVTALGAGVTSLFSRSTFMF